jgi:hypothetical protein
LAFRLLTVATTFISYALGIPGDGSDFSFLQLSVARQSKTRAVRRTRFGIATGSTSGTDCDDAAAKHAQKKAGRGLTKLKGHVDRE